MRKHALVAQWIERRTPNAEIEVQFLSGAPLKNIQPSVSEVGDFLMVSVHINNIIAFMMSFIGLIEGFRAGVDFLNFRPYPAFVYYGAKEKIYIKEQISF